jgi:hypothetical protein
MKSLCGSVARSPYLSGVGSLTKRGENHVNSPLGIETSSKAGSWSNKRGSETTLKSSRTKMVLANEGYSTTAT